MAGFSNDVVYGTGLDLSGGIPASNKLNVDGKIYIGSSSGNPQASVPTDGTNISWIAGPGTLQSNITGQISGSNGGTGVNNGTKTITLGGNLTTSGAFNSTFTMTGATGVTFPTSGTLATTSQLPANPLTLATGGTSANLTASNGGIFYSTASAGAILSGTSTANKILMSGSSAAPTWSTPTFPTAAGTSGNVLKSDGTNWTSAAVPAIVTINGDSSSVTGSTVTFNGPTQGGATVKFNASGTTMSLYTTDGSFNTSIGFKSGNGSGTALSGSNNTCLGYETGYSIGGGGNNTCIGMQSYLFGSGSNNLIIGVNQAGSAYTGNESGNLLICSTGVLAESNVTRIGTGQTKFFAAGINGVTVSNQQFVTINSSTDQLGVVATIPNSFAPYSFKVDMNASATNLTGDNTAAVVIFDRVRFDQGGGTNYSTSTGIYTIPATGTYIFGGALTVGNLLVGHTQMYMKLNRVGIINDQLIEINPFVVCVAGDNSQVQIPFSFITLATAADQFEIILTVAGSTKTVWVRGDGFNSCFWGYRIA